MFGLTRRNIPYKEKELTIPLYRVMVRPGLEYFMQAWRPYRYILERIQRRATDMIPELRYMSLE